MSTVINSDVNQAVDTARTKQFVDAVVDVAGKIAAITPIAQDDLVVQALKMIVDQPWFLAAVTKLVNTPHTQRVAMVANPEELMKDVAC